MKIEAQIIEEGKYHRITKITPCCEVMFDYIVGLSCSLTVAKGKTRSSTRLVLTEYKDDHFRGYEQYRHSTNVCLNPDCGQPITIILTPIENEATDEDR